MSVEDLLQRIAEEEGPDPTTPGCFYSQDADCVFCHVEDVPHHAERVDDRLTVYRADDDGRLVGAQIKRVSRVSSPAVLGSLRSRLPGEVPVVQLLLLAFQSQEQPEAASERRKATYFDVLSRVQELSIPASDLQRP